MTDYRFGYENQSVSQETLSKIDVEVSNILNTAYKNAVTLIKKYRTQLDAVSLELVKSESMDQDQFEKIVGKKISSEEETISIID